MTLLIVSTPSRIGHYYLQSLNYKYASFIFCSLLLLITYYFFLIITFLFIIIYYLSLLIHIPYFFLIATRYLFLLLAAISHLIIPATHYLLSLSPVEAEAVVSGPSEVHIEEGSKLALECHVRFAASPPVYIFWYHNSTMVNYARQHSLEVCVRVCVGVHACLLCGCAWGGRRRSRNFVCLRVFFYFYFGITFSFVVF